MKLLAISDPHGDYSHIADLLKRANDIDGIDEIDRIIIVGDLTNFGPDGDAEKLFDILPDTDNIASMAIPGNCDPLSIQDVIAKRSILLHDNVVVVDDIAFMGIGGSNPTPFNTAFELSEDEIKKILDKLLKHPDVVNAKFKVLVSHAPPKDTLDRIPGATVGSTAIRGAIGKVDLIICGHIHEDQGEMIEDGTVIVNVGQVAVGKGAIITLGGTQDGGIGIELL